MSDMMTKEKIKNLVERIKAEFPHGCGDMDCNECPAHNEDYETSEFVMCEMLSAIESFTRGD